MNEEDMKEIIGGMIAVPIVILLIVITFIPAVFIIKYAFIVFEWILNL